MHELHLSATADEDLDEIWRHVAVLSGINRANKLIDEITDTMNLAATFPGGGSSRESLRRGLRSYPSGNYLVLFKKSGRRVTITRVIHGARDLTKLFPARKPRKRK